MARVVVCPHCSASHRTVGGQTRFTCDYCQSLVRVSAASGLEELVVPSPPSLPRARAAALRWLARKGVHRPRVEALDAMLAPVWQVVSQRGEEHTVCGLARPSALVRSLVLPATPVVARGEGAALGLEPLPEPDVTRAEAENAAMATFGDRDPTVESVRLVWLPLVTLRAHTPGGSVEGLYLAGAEKVLFAPLPPGARDAPVDGHRIAAYATFLALAAVVGLTLGSATARAAAEAGLAGLAWLAFRRGTPWSPRPHGSRR